MTAPQQGPSFLFCRQTNLVARVSLHEMVLLVRPLKNIDFHLIALVGMLTHDLTDIVRQHWQRMIAFAWRAINYRHILWLHEAWFTLSLRRIRQDSFDLVARSNIHQVIGVTAQHPHSLTILRREVLGSALHHGNTTLFRDLETCSAKLQCCIDSLPDDKPVIFAPLHGVSDHVASAVCALAGLRNVSVVSAYPDDVLGSTETDVLTQRGSTMDHLNIRDLAGPGLKKCLSRVTAKKTHLVIFPDALPEFTEDVAGRSMRTSSLRLFGRQARLHTGLEDLARLAKARVIYFCMTTDAKGRVGISILANLGWDEIKEKNGEVIEGGIRAHHDSWMLWNVASLFYLNPLNP